MAVLSRLDIEISANSARFQQEIQEVSAVSRRAAAQLQRDQQQQAQSRLQIERQYASQERQAQIDLTEEIIRIRQARFNIADENRYTQQAIQAAQRRTAEVAAIEQNKARESAEKAATNRLQIERQYASDHRKIEIDLANELERIRAAGFNDDDQNRLIQQARDNAQAQVDAIADQERATTNYGEKAKIAFGYVAAGAGIAAAAIGALIKEQIELASQLNQVALKSNTSAEAIQKYTIGATATGIEMDKLGDIFKDTQDKVGDFLSTGGGEMQDFFDNVAPKVGVTADEFRKLSGPDALQLYYNSLEKANLSQNEMVFYMEAVADEASALIPLLHDNAAGFKAWEKAAENAGAKMDEKTIRATQDLQTSTKLLGMSYQGVKNQIAAQFMPVLSDLAANMVKDTTLKEQAAAAGKTLAEGFKFIVATGYGVVGIFKLIGSYAGAMGAAILHPLDAFNIMKSAWEDAKSIVADVNKSMEATFNLGASGRANSQVTQLTNYTIATEKYKNMLGETGKQIQDNREKEKELAKEREKIAKEQASGKYAPIPVNSTVLAHASRYGYSELEKRYGLPAGLLSAISMQESRGNPNATSYVGAKGEFQFMPATARRFGIAGQERNTAVASEAAAKYLSQHLRMFGDLDKAIAAYNAGEGNVQKFKWDTIMSNRFAKGQTFDYVKNVRRYLSFMNGGKAIDGGYDIASAMASEAQNQQKLEEQKLALQAKYSVESERRAAEHAKNVAEIKKTYTNPNDPERKRLLDQEAADYAHDVNEYELAQAKKVAAFTDFKKSERELVIQNANFEARAAANDSKATLEQKILAMDSIAEQRDLKLKAIDLQEAKERQAANAGHQTAIENIKAEAQLQRDELALNITMDTNLRQAKIDAINAQEQESLRQLRDAFESELANVTSYAKTELQRLRDDYKAKRDEIDRNPKYSDAQKSDLRNALAGAQNNAIRVARQPAESAYSQLTNEMNGAAEYAALENQMNSRLDIIKKAKDAEIITVEQAESAKAQIERQYQIARYDMMMSQGQQILGSVTSSLKATLGEHSKAYRVMFAVERGVNIARSLMAINTGIALAAANPFPMNLGAMVSVASATASIVSDLMAIKNPVGQAHDGIMSVPESGTWNLQKGERVLPEYTAKRLDRTLDDVSKKGNGGNVNIVFENHTSATISQAPSKDGEMRFIIRDEIDSYVPQQLSRTNTPISQALLQNTTATRRV